MILSAPICLADSTPSKPTAPSPTTTTVEPGFNVRRIGGKPSGAHNVGERQQARHHLARRNVRGSHQGAVSEWHAQQRRLRRADELRVLARGLITDLAVGTGVVGREE